MMIPVFSVLVILGLAAVSLRALLCSRFASSAGRAEQSLMVSFPTGLGLLKTLTSLKVGDNSVVPSFRLESQGYLGVLALTWTCHVFRIHLGWPLCRNALLLLASTARSL